MIIDPKLQQVFDEASAEVKNWPEWMKSKRKEGDVAMTETELIQSFDARVWAKEFIECVKANPNIATDEGTMIGWFANALMRGYDEATRPSHDDDLTSRRCESGRRILPSC